MKMKKIINNLDNEKMKFQGCCTDSRYGTIFGEVNCIKKFMNLFLLLNIR
jgi:hypothetical protein